MNKDFSFLKESVNPQTPDHTLLIMSYEIGCVIEYATDEANKSLGSAAQELGDVASMTRMFCEQVRQPFPLDDDAVRHSMRSYSLNTDLLAKTTDGICLRLADRFGRVSRCYQYDRVYGPAKHPHGPMLRTIGDFVDVQRALAHKLGTSFASLLDIGEEHYLERMDDLRKYGSPSATAQSEKVSLQLILTPRRIQILKMMADGMTYKEIAAKLDIMEHTVKNHMYGAYKLLGVSNGVQLAVLAVRKGLI